MSRPDDEVELSVIVCTHNGARLLPESLAAILGQEWDGTWELLVVDNDSDDGTTPALLAAVAADEPRMRVVEARAARGAPHARNVGVAAARGRSVAFVDDDDVVADGWLAAMGEALREHPYVAQRVRVDEVNPPAVAATRVPPQTVGVATFRGVPVVSTQMGVRRRWYLDADGFDETIPGPAGEDTDFALRLHERHRTAPVWVEGAVVHYRLRGEPRVLVRQGRRYGRVHPLLHRRWDALCPEPRPSLGLGLKEWGRLVLEAPAALVRPRSHLRWWFRLGVKLGRLQGSVEYRSLVL